MIREPWTVQDERDPFAKSLKRDPRELYGALDYHQASHWCVENLQNLTIETWVKTGPNYQFVLRTRIRPMTEQEVILAKVRDHSRETVLRAFGIDPDDLVPKSYVAPKKPWWKFWA